MAKILIGYSACTLTRAALEAHGHDVWVCDLLPRWANQADSGQNNMSPGADRWLQRSATYPGIAAAMGDQWGRHMLGRDAVKAADNDNTPFDELKVTA